MALVLNLDKPKPVQPSEPPLILDGRPVMEGKLDQLAQQTYAYLTKMLGQRDGRAIWDAGQKIVDLLERQKYYAWAVVETEKMVSEQEIEAPALSGFEMFHTKPADVRTFLCDPYFLDKEKEIYPVVMDELIELNSGKYVEAVLTGGIGSGKTTTALYTNAYQLYLLSCMRSPHRTYGLDPSSEILLIFQSITKKLAESVDFARFKAMIASSPYFREKYPFDKNLTSKLVFPNRIEVIPVAGTETAAIGQNVIGGLIDELNYMAVIEKSKQSVDKGTYDQAVQVYNSIARRRQSRFENGGKMPGILCLVSSKKYPGQFTDQKQEEAKTNPTIYVYDKRVWEIKPEKYTQGWFHVFIGDETRRPRVLVEDEEVEDEDRELVMAIPVEFKVAFDGPHADIINALREIAGVSTVARHPYMQETERVAASMKKSHLSIFSRDSVDFVSQGLGIRKEHIYRPELPRFVHVDLAISGDCAGLAIGTVKAFKSMKELDRGEDDSLMPVIHIDGVLEVVPPKGAEILFWKIREVIIALRDKLGMNVRWVTFDSFESKDSEQILRQASFVTGTQSMDILPCTPYAFTKSAIYDGRVDMPEHVKLRKELISLERDLKTGKIDHPPAGSKDCADALAGVVYGLTMRREIWGMFSVPLIRIPASVMGIADKLTEKNDKLRATAAQAEGRELMEHEKVIRRAGDRLQSIAR